MEMTTVKTFAVMAVIFGCFAVLYPKIFHPVILSVFGAGSSQQQTDKLGNRLPPHLKKPNMGNPRPMPGGGPQDDIARHMRAGPHPGMRAAAEMQKQVNTQGSGGKGGMMTVVLPMYAIGIVVYLIYTLSKVFGGRKKSADDEYVKRHFNKRKPLREVRYDAERKKFLYGEEDSEEDDTGVKSIQRSRKQQRDLERLLFKADREKISDLEMHELKRRLLETESQMTRILQAMESVQERVPNQMMEDEQQFDEEEYDDIREEKENTRPIRQSQKRRKKMEVRKPPKNMPRKCNVYAGEKLKRRKDDEVKVESAKVEELKNDVKKEYLEAVNGEVDADEDYSDDFEGQEADVEEVGPEEASSLEDQEEKEEEGERSLEEESDSEESIPEEIDSNDSDDDDDELEDLTDSEDVDDSEEVEDSEVEEEDEGPTEEEVLVKMSVKHSKGKTKVEQLVSEDVDGGSRGNQEDECADVIDSDKEQQLSQVHKDLRRRKKPPKENQTK